jgi:hypothetical protein
MAYPDMHPQICQVVSIVKYSISYNHKQWMHVMLNYILLTLQINLSPSSTCIIEQNEMVSTISNCQTINIFPHKFIRVTTTQPPYSLYNIFCNSPWEWHSNYKKNQNYSQKQISKFVKLWVLKVWDLISRFLQMYSIGTLQKFIIQSLKKKIQHSIKVFQWIFFGSPHNVLKKLGLKILPTIAILQKTIILTINLFWHCKPIILQFSNWNNWYHVHHESNKIKNKKMFSSWALM